jgi:hypothetical protein
MTMTGESAFSGDPKSVDPEPERPNQPEPELGSLDRDDDIIFQPLPAPADPPSEP